MTAYAPPPVLPPNRRVRKRKTAVEVAAPMETMVSSPAVAPRVVGTASILNDRTRAALGVLLSVAVALGCVYGLVRYTRKSPRFMVTSVEVEGTVHTTASDLAKIGGLQIGVNVFTIDVEAARARILSDPWIEKATIQRRLPGTIRVEVGERDAFAMLALGQKMYLVTRQGEIFKRALPGDPSDLPTVTGLMPDLVARDRPGAVGLIKRALDLVGEYERTPPAKTLPVQEVHMHDDGALSLVVGKDPIILRMGRGPYRQTVEQAAKVLAEVPRRGVQASVVFLDNEAHPERVVVRMR
jgi:cell division protein FtsQ